ncbi:DNA/RNA non-specific endonuclease [Herbaspirillum robiniae]|uniref:Endonuclease n=1 Tax=Herbaspirillum robiniae TaxID=2014887 RepID=A0A246WRV0_9BURK|nr:DNA/RNA non-specific endonuclease [Herbaspirillum robiniae]OWY28822.1 endonuclease [Herbaspirillum robiniae]
MVTKQKKAAPRKRSTSRKSKSKRLSTLSRFLISFTSTTIIVFGIASCVLNPQLTEDIRNASYLPHLDWSDEDGSAPIEKAEPGSTVTRFSQCPQFFPGARPPQLPAGAHLRELCFSAFAILYNTQTKTPFIAVERLNRATLIHARDQHRTNRFYAESRLPRAARAALDDYKGSGYARGHMAPAGDMSTPESMAQSFSLANMVPQNQAHNSGPWSKIEQDTRKYVMRAQGDVFVYTGPLFESSIGTIGRGRIAVPDHIFKLIYDVNNGRSWAYVQPNRADTRTGPPIDYDAFVRRTGLHLLPQGGAHR